MILEDETAMRDEKLDSGIALFWMRNVIAKPYTKSALSLNLLC